MEQPTGNITKKKTEPRIPNPEEAYAIVRSPVGDMYWGFYVDELLSNRRFRAEAPTRDKPVYTWHFLTSVAVGTKMMKQYDYMMMEKRQRLLDIEQEYSNKVKQLFHEDSKGNT
jgi:hypothetical protein